MGRRFNPEAVLPIELELAKEKASALARVGDKLEKLIAALHQIEAEFPRLAGEARARKRAEHEELRAQALQQRYNLIVQREAMGLYRHHDVDRIYPIPPKLSQDS